MDKEMLKRMKEADKKAAENMKKRELAQDAKFKEFWEERLNILEANKKTFLANLEETEFLIDCYKKRLKLFG